MSFDQRERPVEQESGSFPWAVVAGVIIVLAILGGGFAAGWFANDARADGSTDPQKDLIVRLDRNRLGIVVGTAGNQVCVTLLSDKFTPEDPVACVDTDQILNYTDYDYGPSVFPSLGEMYDIHYVSDRGVQEGVVFYKPGNGPKPLPEPTTSDDETSTMPGVDLPSPTPSK